MATHKQYIVPTSGKPIRGLIQDSVVSGVFLSSKDSFLNKDQYQQLVYVGLRELLEEGHLKRIFTLPPAILKPRPLWTGKQVVSTILKNLVPEGSQGLNLDSKSRLSASEWGPNGKEEGDVIFRDNELL
jgi:DNA-directed RNA polymerase I subunit RPA1